jgi:hypothetical protein
LLLHLTQPIVQLIQTVLKIGQGIVGRALESRHPTAQFVCFSLLGEKEHSYGNGARRQQHERHDGNQSGFWHDGLLQCAEPFLPAYHLMNANSEISFDNDHLAAGNDAVVDNHVDWLGDGSV